MVLGLQCAEQAKVSSAGPRRARPRVPSAEQPLSQTPPAGCDPPDGCGEVTGSERPRAAHGRSRECATS